MRLLEIRRVSTEEQARGDRSGLERQSESNRRRAAELGAEIAGTYEIVDVSRTHFAHTPEWTEISARIAEPDLHLVLDAPDRLVAGLEGMAILLRCKDTNTRIYTASGEVDLATLSGVLVSTIQAVFSGEELASIKHRAQGGKEAKRRQGRFATSDIALATGIAFDRSSGHWGYTDEITRPQRAFELLVVEGVHNLAAIGRDPGVRASIATVRNWLRNPILRGEVVYREKRAPGPTPMRADGRRKDRRKVPRAPHEIIRHQVYRPRGEPAAPGDTREEAAVHEVVWDAAQEILDEKRAAVLLTREPVGFKFNYTGHLWCHPHGTPMWGRPRRGSGESRRDYYCCKVSQMPGGKCETGYLERRRLHSCLDQLFTLVLSDERLVAGLIDASLKGEHQDYSGQIEARLSEVERLRAKRSKVLDLYLGGAWDRAELDVKRMEVDAMVERAEREVRRLEQLQTSVASGVALDRLREILVTLAEFEFWSPVQKRDLVRKFFPRIAVSRRGVETVRTKLPLVASVAGRDVPVPDHDVPLDMVVGMTWEQLTPPPIQPRMTEFGLAEQRSYSRRDLRTVLGLSEHQLRVRLESGQIPEPRARVQGKRAWSLEELREIVTRARDSAEVHRWGLPRKPHYTSGDACRIVGLSFERLRYLIDTGVLPDCQRRDAGGQRWWTEREIERLLEAAGTTIEEEREQ